MLPMMRRGNALAFVSSYINRYNAKGEKASCDGTSDTNGAAVYGAC